MTVQTQAIYSHVVKATSRWIEIPILIGFNLILVASAYLSINLPFSPVPITGQTFGVLLIAMTLGRVRATAVISAYLIEGAMGLPVFAGGAFGAQHLVGPTGGYLIGFLAAGFVVGSMADKGWDRSYFRSIVSMTLGHAIIFICGLVWLAQFVPSEALLAAGLTPFLIGTAIKTGLAACCLPTAWKLISRGDRH
jgi:biotin transport system substrate-specific component